MGTYIYDIRLCCGLVVDLVYLMLVNSNNAHVESSLFDAHTSAWVWSVSKSTRVCSSQGVAMDAIFCEHICMENILYVIFLFICMDKMTYGIFARFFLL
jgi:hypothetical protein